MKRNSLRAALFFFVASFAGSPSIGHARPQELTTYGLWEGLAKGGLSLQSTLYLRPHIEIAAAVSLSAGPNCVRGGVLAGPRLILDLASWVPALSLLAGIIGGQDVHAGLVGQVEVLHFLTPHTGLAAKAGALWVLGNGVAPQVGFGYFWRA